MPRELSCITIGRHRQALVEHYCQDRSVYASLEEGAHLVVNEYYLSPTSAASRELASALGIDLNDAATWNLSSSRQGDPSKDDPSKDDPAHVRIERLLATQEDLVARIAARENLVSLAELSRAGHMLCFMPG